MSWWKHVWPKRPSDTERTSELRFHLEELIQDKIAEGLSHEEARREAILEFGGEQQLREELRDVYRIATLENILANLKYAFRFIRRSPSFSATVVVTLALGIGANTAVFSAIDAVLLRPLPFPNPGRLTVLHEYKTNLPTPESHVAPIRLEEWNRLNSTFQSISGYYEEDVTDTSGQLPEKITQALVAPRFLETMGVSPALGRDFTPAEERFGGPNAVIISNRYWLRRFQGDPRAIGKSVRTGRSSSPIIGIMPASFQFPDRDVDLWFPVPPDAPYSRDRQSTWYTAIGRLKPGVNISKARANLAAVQSQLGKQYPKTDANMTVEINALKEATVGGARRSLWLLFGSVSLLLLIACTNIAALLLARTIQREREISVRFALGASRRSVMAQLITEALVLAVFGAALGLVVAGGAASVFQGLAKSLPRVEEISLDWRILVYALGCALVTAILCGLFPALHATRRSIAGSLARTSRTQVSGRNPLQWTLVGVQVALAVTLLAGAGLLLRSFQALGQVSPGFDPTHVLTFHVTGSYGETADMKGLSARINRTLDALRALPGVTG
ncbi:MAG: ABC transporter permease, partial [Bryobacteraceae bacterium]